MKCFLPIFLSCFRFRSIIVVGCLPFFESCLSSRDVTERSDKQNSVSAEAEVGSEIKVRLESSLPVDYDFALPSCPRLFLCFLRVVGVIFFILQILFPLFASFLPDLSAEVRGNLQTDEYTASPFCVLLPLVKRRSLRFITERFSVYL